MLPRQIIARYLSDLAQKLAMDLEALLRDRPLDEHKAKSLAAWLKQNFHFEVSRTPKGGKEYKKALEALHWYLAHGNPLEHYRSGIEAKWAELQIHLDDVVRLFTDEGGTVVPKELRLGSNTYVNQVGFPEAKLRAYAEGLEQVFAELKSWRRKALEGGLTVVLASPKSFQGTAGGKYRSSEDALYVRATPHVLKRTRGTYASLDYVLVHELGHRYDHKVRPTIDFDRPEWWTTPYSRKEGEAFAELFALSNFGLSESGTAATLERFEKYMQR